ncbi:cold shock domain-containing protein [Candidatus Woesearchaeota archaeon]|nr:cold shock domain-containing protein [Candidatus Woesearchaeota archaeon]
MEGTVKWYNLKKGYGFIKGEDEQDYFVHFSALNGAMLRENDKVSFDAVDTERGKQAQKVKLLQKGSEIKGEGRRERGKKGKKYGEGDQEEFEAEEGYSEEGGYEQGEQGEQEDY